MFEKTQELVTFLNYEEEPMGLHYTDILPEGAKGPKKAVLGENSFSCFIGNIFTARKKKGAAFISAEESGCVGGAFYTGVLKPYAEFIPYYVSTGNPNMHMHGERYMSSPEVMRNFLNEVEPPKASAKYCVVKPLSAFGGDEPDVIIFFARPEVMCGLYTLVSFATGDPHAVVSPFGAGCTNICAWPYYYIARGEDKAVIGGFDPSARKFMKGDELSFAITLNLYKRMLAALDESLFHTDSWQSVRKKTERSIKAWEKAL